MNDRNFPPLGSYHFGLSESEEKRALRIHDEAIIIDFAFVHPGGYRVFEREPFKSGYQRLVGEYAGLELMEKLAFKFPYEADLDHMRALWAQSGVTVGLVDAYYDMTKVDEPQANLEIIDLVPWLRLVRNAADIRAAKAANEHALMLFCQPVGTVPRDLGAFERAYAGGLRTFMLTYNKTNVIGCGCTERLNHGLTDFGVELMALLGELGVIVDLSHCGRATTLEACKISKHPVTANHTGAQALFEHARLKSDEELRAIADTGGIIGVFAIPFFMSRDADAGIDILLDHIDYIANLVGWQHVGLGSDTPHVAPKTVLADVFDAATMALLGFRPEDNVTPTQNFVGFDDYTAIALPPDGSSTYFLPRLIGPKRAYELMAMNRTLSASEARDLGIVNQIFPAENFAKDAEAYARRLANGPTQALGHAKNLLTLSTENALETAMEFERRAIADCGRSADFVEGANAFVNKRVASFIGS